LNSYALNKKTDKSIDIGNYLIFSFQNLNNRVGQRGKVRMLGKKTINKRFFDRKKYGANILFTHKGKSYSGKIKDISLNGAFIVVPYVYLFKKNDPVVINIPFVNNNSHVSRTGHIIRITKEGFAIKFV
jgi:aspartate-semialdehyde dehydrogenase